MSMILRIVLLALAFAAPSPVTVEDREPQMGEAVELTRDPLDCKHPHGPSGCEWEP